MPKKGMLLVFLTAVISGFSVFINKFGVDITNPYVFTFLKNTVVALLLGGLILALKDFGVLRRLKLKQWFALILIGLMGGSIPFLLFFKGLSLTGAAQGSFIQKTMFIYVAILAVIFLKEKISKNFIIGSLFLLIGNILALKSLKFSFGYGDLLVLAATLFWAVENIISKFVLRNLPSTTVAWGRMFFGSIFILGYLSLSGQTGTLSTLNFAQISWILITSVLLFGYVITWYSGLKHVPVSVATSVLLLGSPITTLLAALSAGKFEPKETISGIIILCGLLTIISMHKISKKNHLIT
jgi:drug/metabolite transporter (DMT)-like permease